MTVNFADDILINISDDGMTDALWQLAHDDNEKLAKINIKNEKQRNLFFYLEHFIDDLCEEFNCKDLENKEATIINAFNILKDEEKVDLTDIRKAVYKVINKKLAYPNTKGTHESNSVPIRDVDKWIKALNDIYNLVNSGISYSKSFAQITEEWSPMEKSNFESWIRYYENADHEKYAFSKLAETSIPYFTEEEIKKSPGRPRVTEKTLDQEKQALIQRLDSASKILRNFAQVWPTEVWQRLSGMLSDLQREIVTLKTASTIVDCIIRTANKLERAGFSEGAYALIKIAEPPESDVASKIEKALSGRTYEETAPEAPQGDLGLGGDLGAGMPPIPGGEATMPPLGGETMPMGDLPPADNISPPAGVEENLPAPEMPPLAPPIEEKEEEPINNNENPFKGKNITVKDILNILEPLSKELSERKFVRELSKADLMLDGMDMASFFPELSEAMGKALELNTYVNTRIEKIINKLKGGLKEGDEEKKSGSPEIDMGEFSKSPGKEKEMFEVAEEPKAPEMPPKPGV